MQRTKHNEKELLFRKKLPAPFLEESKKKIAILSNKDPSNFINKLPQNSVLSKLEEADFILILADSQKSALKLIDKYKPDPEKTILVCKNISLMIISGIDDLAKKGIKYFATQDSISFIFKRSL